MSAPAPADPVRYLAGRVVGWFVLHTFHHEGFDAAAAAMNAVGGAGRDPDGVWRCWDAINAGRHRIALMEGSTTEAPRVVRLREVFEWAAARLEPADWRRLDELVAQRWAAIEEVLRDRELSHRKVFDPRSLTEADRRRIGASERRRVESEVLARALVASRLDDPGPAAGDQLRLFTL